MKVSSLKQMTNEQSMQVTDERTNTLGATFRKYRKLAQHWRNVPLAFLLNELLQKSAGVCI